MICLGLASFHLPFPVTGMRIGIPRKMRLETAAGTTTQGCYNVVFGRHYSGALSRSIDNDDRARLSRLWVPTGGIATPLDEDSQSKLVRAGFLRQAHSGIFHLLPLGRRVQDKLEALIDKYMSRLGASKLALSSISSEEIWAQSGRLQSVGSELFRFRDRKDVGYLLSPTHEEEITSLVSSTVKSYREFPVRLYQISRKYRDERRPRHGLLRSREFVMKDLYTFDYSASLALATYHQVRGVYAQLFDELKIPYLVAEADSGDMGGNLSHEFHFPTPRGEDHIISCTTCNYIANEELVESPVLAHATDDRGGSKMPLCAEPTLQTQNDPKWPVIIQAWRGISLDRCTLVNVWYSSPASSLGTLPSFSPIAPEVNVHAVKAVLPELDASIGEAVPFWNDHARLPPDTASPLPGRPRRLVNLVDYRVPPHISQSLGSRESHFPLWPTLQAGPLPDIEIETHFLDPSTRKPLNLLRIKDGDVCPRCSGGTLMVQKAVELGHTFHLGTRYSDPLKATVSVPSDLLSDEVTRAENTRGGSSIVQQVNIQMGCHGIGVSRMIGAVADTLADAKGLNWPRVMAPFEVVIVPGKGLEDASLEVYDALSAIQSSFDSDLLDLVLDDRIESFAWKMQDADLVGYPVIVVVGRRWKTDKMCEVQCRRLGVREEVAFEDVLNFVRGLLSKL